MSYNSSNKFYLFRQLQQKSDMYNQRLIRQAKALQEDAQYGLDRKDVQPTGTADTIASMQKRYQEQYEETKAEIANLDSFAKRSGLDNFTRLYTLFRFGRNPAGVYFINYNRHLFTVFGRHYLAVQYMGELTEDKDMEQVDLNCLVAQADPRLFDDAMDVYDYVKTTVATVKAAEKTVDTNSDTFRSWVAEIDKVEAELQKGESKSKTLQKGERKSESESLGHSTGFGAFKSETKGERKDEKKSETKSEAKTLKKSEPESLGHSTGFGAFKSERAL